MRARCCTWAFQKTCPALAGWYRNLHARSRAWVATHGKGLYDENDLITPENLALVRARTGPLPV